MKRHWAVGLVALALLTLPSLASAQTKLIARLTGAAEVPPGGSTGAGLAVFTLTTTAQGPVASYNIVLAGIANVAGVSISAGLPGTVGGEVFPIPAQPSATHRTGTWGSADPANPQPLSSDVVQQLVNGQLYLDVFTAAHPKAADPVGNPASGEIRGQIQLGGPDTHFALLDGTQETPPTGSTGSGIAIVTLDATHANLTYDLVTDGLTNVTAAHIHTAAVGVSGPVTFPIASGPFVEAVGTTPISPDQVTTLQQGGMYVNVHTQANVNGEIRGQIQSAMDASVHFFAQANTTIQSAANSTAAISLFVSGANKLTVGGFTVTLVPHQGMPTAALPSITGFTAGLATAAASTACASSSDPTSCNQVATSTVLPTGPTPVVGGPLRTLFIVPSAGTTGNETGGISGDNQEVARVDVSLPAGATVGQMYDVVISGPDFSNASSQSLPVTLGPVGTLTVINQPPGIAYLSDTAYRDPAFQNQPLLAPTSAANTTFPIGFPNDGRAVGNQTYTFTLTPTNLGNGQIDWTVTAANHGNSTFYTPGQLTNLTGTVTANGNGVTATYTPADASMQMPRAIDLTFTATVHGAPAPVPASEQVTIIAVLFPYGDANLDGRVTGTDAFLAFKWSIGQQLPVAPAGTNTLNLAKYVGTPIRRLLTDVRPVPGGPVSVATFNKWVQEYQNVNATPLPQQADFDRTGFPFGDGAVAAAEAFWIFKKGVFTANGGAPSTIDPRAAGILSMPFGF